MVRRLSDLHASHVASLVLSERDEDGCCRECREPMETTDDLEPTPLCNPCAQEAAVVLARAVKRLQAKQRSRTPNPKERPQ